MTALSLYKIFYDKAIKIVFSLIYLLYFAYEVWWLSESLILLKMKNCSSEIAIIEAANPYQKAFLDPLYDEKYLEAILDDYYKTYIGPKFRLLSNTSFYCVTTQAFIIFSVILVALFLIRRMILKK